MQIANKVFLITGGGGGIGLAIGALLLSRGAHVALADNDTKRLLESRKLLTADHQRVSTHLIDVTDEQNLSRLSSDVHDAHGQIDGLIHTAGIAQRFAPFLEVPPDEVNRVLDVNLKGAICVTRQILPDLLARPEACLVYIASLSSLVPFGGQTIYAASKGGLRLFSEGLSQELNNTRVRITTVYPGTVDTSLAANSGTVKPDTKGHKIPMTTPEQLASQVVRAITRHKVSVVVGREAQVLSRLTRIAPKLTNKLLGRTMKKVL